MLSYYRYGLTYFYRSKKAYTPHRNISTESMYYTM